MKQTAERRFGATPDEDRDRTSAPFLRLVTFEDRPDEAAQPQRIRRERRVRRIDPFDTGLSFLMLSTIIAIIASFCAR
jgi:hypothetical protein